MYRTILFILCLSSSFLCHTQTAVLSAGGDATNASGSVSYSIGQTFYIHTDGTNGTIHEGVQQPYEFFTVSIHETHANLNLLVFPNPTLHLLTLQMDQFIPGLTASIYNQNGQLIFESNMLSSSMPIDASSWAAGSYILRLSDASNSASQYTIIKH
ncbi:MAG: T9SS type A sorting domain-containing protein [Flavobacteriales bacterium]